MEGIKEIIRNWLTHCGIISTGKLIDGRYPYHGFIVEYERHYATDFAESCVQFSTADLKNAVFSPEGYLTDIEVYPDYISVRYSGINRWKYVKGMIIGFEACIKCSEFSFDLIINSGGIIRIPVNEILNDYLSNTKFTRGLLINSFDDLEDVFRNMFGGCADLSRYINDLSCPEYRRFILKTDFLDEYEKMNLSCNRNKSGYKSDKKNVLNLLKEYEGVSAKYCSNDRYYCVTRDIDDVTIGYNVIISYNTLIEFIIWGKRNEESLFCTPGIEWIVKEHGSGHKLASLQFQSLAELKVIFDFMLKHLDVLYSLFNAN